MENLDEFGILTVFIDGPERNFLNPGVMRGLLAQLKAANENESVKAILLTGKGEAFCGGLDLAAIRAGGDPVEFAACLSELLKEFPRLRKPVAAAVNGDAVASGGSMVAAVDYAVSVKSAKIGSYEVAVGVWPMVAQVPLIHRLGARAAMENIGSGNPLTADRAFEIGLVNAVTDDEHLISMTKSWLIDATRAGAAAHGRVSYYELAAMSYDDALDAALDKFAAQFK